MRAWFAKQLDELRGQLVVTAASVTSSIRWATESLLEQDLDAARKVSDAAAEMRAARVRIEEMVLELLVRQQPVATDLRLALAGLHVVGDLDRMAALADHIAKIVVLRHPVPVVPTEIRPAVHRMGEVAEGLAWTVTRALEMDDPGAVTQMERDDDIVDTLHRDMFGLLFSEWAHGVQAAVDLTLICRYYERYADHAVNAGHQVVFMVTGTTPPA